MNVFSFKSKEFLLSCVKRALDLKLTGTWQSVPQALLWIVENHFIKNRVCVPLEHFDFAYICIPLHN